MFSWRSWRKPMNEHLMRRIEAERLLATMPAEPPVPEVVRDTPAEESGGYIGSSLWRRLDELYRLAKWFESQGAGEPARRLARHCMDYDDHLSRGAGDAYRRDLGPKALEDAALVLAWSQEAMDGGDLRDAANGLFGGAA
jgi:hypothetical protein